MFDENEITLAAIVKRIESQYEGVSLYENYSGRGMYNRTTTGISVNQYADIDGLQLGAVILAEGLSMIEEQEGEVDVQDGLAEIFDLIPKRSDSLGLGTIYY